MKISTIDTVNVITYINGAVFGIVSFKDHKKGNKQAEHYFRTVIKKDFPETTDEDIDACMDNGIFESTQGDVQLFITHSE